ncbi:MAG: MBL fold metallo-hydrolase [Bacteroidia bacterium]|nr:MBL fold metallo-hydrolase [Bacteroidia bacterium]
MNFIFILSILLIFIIGYLYLPEFGKKPKNERLLSVLASPNYKNGSFKNISFTPDLTEGVTYPGVMKEFIFTKKLRMKPEAVLPSEFTDLKNVDPERDFMVWMGHSSYFIQVDCKKILVDPVFSGAASPLSFTTKAFVGSDVYKVEDLPAIDYLFISHDHWDHMDYKTIVALKLKVKKIICGLGVGQHFERWGFEMKIIIEKDWNESFDLDPGFTVNTVSARHFSGRGIKRNQSLWMSYALKTPTTNIFIGGDSGYDSHFAEAGNMFGPFDIAILENGQYDKSWKYIHMMPEDVLKAASELKAKVLLPVHSSKFALANHAWDTPLKTITGLHHDESIKLITPKIGEEIRFKDLSQEYQKWWERVN